MSQTHVDPSKWDANMMWGLCSPEVMWYTFRPWGHVRVYDKLLQNDQLKIRKAPNTMQSRGRETQPRKNAVDSKNSFFAARYSNGVFIENKSRGRMDWVHNGTQ